MRSGSGRTAGTEIAAYRLASLKRTPPHDVIARVDIEFLLPEPESACAHPVIGRGCAIRSQHRLVCSSGGCASRSPRPVLRSAAARTCAAARRSASSSYDTDARPCHVAPPSTASEVAPRAPESAIEIVTAVARSRIGKRRHVPGCQPAFLAHSGTAAWRFPSDSVHSVLTRIRHRLQSTASWFDRRRRRAGTRRYRRRNTQPGYLEPAPHRLSRCRSAERTYRCRRLRKNAVIRRTALVN